MHGQKLGDISGSIISTLRITYTNPYTNSFSKRTTGSTHFIELLTNHGSGTGVQGVATANITKSEKKAIPNLQLLAFLTARTVPTHSFFCPSWF